MLSYFQRWKTLINNLYDIKSKGVKPQTLQLGDTNKAKLTAEEIAIATCRSIYSVRAMRYKLKKLDEERTGIRIN